ncbi:fatty acid desaturase [uncultured Gimesia sp.]|uniref:fatty acid desaturase family protein n=1 Tax=uncultured Gimesia sp. TaxID=1678688 RepID=UPI0030DC690D|tara:strand:- start:60831 stop:61646 length:816 start_codon:yes stop_codon:yes gene_type:complete
MKKNIAATDLPRLSDIGTDLLQITTCQRVRTLSIPVIACLAYWLFACYGYWVFAVLSLVVMSFVTYGSTSHDLVHHNLGLKRSTNEFFLLLIEAISLRSGHAYQVVHLNHHARFPHEDDIEADASRMSFLRAILEGFVFQFRIYIWALRNPRGRLNWIIAEGVIVFSLILGAMIASLYTIIPIIYVGLMIAGSWIIPLITAYIPHVPQETDTAHQTRLFRGILFRLIAFDHLYHLEHHLYPNVPHQNWHRLAQRLDPWFEKIGLQSIRFWF